MKNKLIRIISSLLILTFLISAMSVFAFASEDSAGEGESKANVLVNRTFDEGWDYGNGFTDATKKNHFFVDYERNADFSYNHFARLEALNGENAYIEVTFGSDVVVNGATMLELSLKMDDYADVNSILDFKVGGTIADMLLGISGGNLVLFPNDSSSGGNMKTTLMPIGDEWVDLQFIFDWNKTKQKGALCITVNYKARSDEKWNTISKERTKNYSGTVYADAYGISVFRIGYSSVSSSDAIAARVGMNYCVDNVRAYNADTAGIVEITRFDYPTDQLFYGKKVNISQAKTVTLMSDSAEKTREQIVADALCLKVNVDKALVKNESQYIYTDKDGKVYGAPYKNENGKVMVPLNLILDYIGFPFYMHPDGKSYDITTGTSTTYITVGRDSAKVNTDRVKLTVAPEVKIENSNAFVAIALDDVESLFPGYLSFFDNMGLIVIYEDTTPDDKEDNTELYNRDDDLDAMLALMKRFIFDFEEGETEEEGYIATGEKLFNDIKENTNNFSHPYLIATQDRFDSLREAYTKGVNAPDYNKTIVSSLKATIDNADYYMRKYSGVTPVNPYTDGDESNGETKDGYAPVGGRLNEISDGFATILPDLAIAYNITLDDKYLDFAYQWMLDLCKWEHWGPGHMLNCASAGRFMALGYDWLYNGMKAKGYDTDIIAQGIYELCVHDGYVSSMDLPVEHYRIIGDSSHYHKESNNWNTVCSGGMITASAAIFGYLEGLEDKTAFNEAIYLVGDNITNLPKYGLDEWAPDGSYIESPTYWGYATERLFSLVMVLDSAAGDDYGIITAPGLETTCYFALHIMDSDSYVWNYHDGGNSTLENGWWLPSMGTGLFHFAGYFFNDPTFHEIREMFLERHGDYGLYDIFYCPIDVDEIDSGYELPLDYYMEGIDAFVSRESWNEGAMYTGLMGGYNEASHGNIDSGNFIYRKHGISWFMDLGSENYECYGMFGGQRHRYYRTNAEGQNVIITESLQGGIIYGQYEIGSGKIIETFSNEHGAYAILDNASAYNTTVSNAKRGIYITNDRQTVVIQDEITPVKAETYWWVAQTGQKVEIDDTGKVAYITSLRYDDNGKPIYGDDGEQLQYTIRVTLLDNKLGLKFTTTTAYEYLLSQTVDVNYSPNNGGQREYSRNGVTRLVVECQNMLTVKMAIVIEEVSSKDSAQPVGYEWISMGAWSNEENLPSAPSSGDITGETNIREIKKDEISTRTIQTSTLLASADAYTRLDEIYDNLAYLELAFDKYDPTDVNYAAELGAYYTQHLANMKKYQAYKTYFDKLISNTGNIAGVLMGTTEKKSVE